jgi:hypothetical protein
MSTLTLNTAARGLDRFSAATKLRTQVRDGVMFIRPTDRKARVNLKKDELLVDLSGGKATIEGQDLTAGAYGLRADKYGWFALTPGHTGRGASVKIAD